MQVLTLTMLLTARSFEVEQTATLMPLSSASAVDRVHKGQAGRRDGQKQINC